MLSHRRFSRPVLSTTQPPLHAKKGLSHQTRVLYYHAPPPLSTKSIRRNLQKNKIRACKPSKTVVFLIGCLGKAEYPGVAKFGIALEWGSRGLEFESRHSDHIEWSPLFEHFYRKAGFYMPAKPWEIKAFFLCPSCEWMRKLSKHETNIFAQSRYLNTVLR